MLALCLQFVISAALVAGWDPVNRHQNDHLETIVTDFYDINYYEADETTLESIKLSNNPNKIILEEVSNTDDTPEIRIDSDWDFKFYGHLHSWFSVSPNGFLTTHPVSCSSFCNWWSGTNGYRRYIAPFMSDFDPSSYEYSKIYYYINNTEESISVQWHNVTLWDASEEYQYDFQVKLKSDGTIAFYYYNIPKLPTNIEISSLYYTSENYSLIVGLEDAAYQHAENGLYYILPISPIDINISHVLQHHIIVLKPKETCIDQLNCTQCKNLVNEPGSTLQCGWCPELGVCSDGLGREIYEYTSHDYCTDNQLVEWNELSTETCSDYEIFERACDSNDHVLAKYPSQDAQDGSSPYYSGVVDSVDSDSNTFMIVYDNTDLSPSHVQYSWVHPCPTVSFDYSSYDLIPYCKPHCSAPISDILANQSNKSRKLIAGIAVTISIIIVLCAVTQFVMYQRRDVDSNSMRNHMAIDQTTARGVALQDNDDDNTLGQYINDNGNDQTYYYSNDKISPGILSPVGTYKNDHIEMTKIENENNKKSNKPHDINHDVSSNSTSIEQNEGADLENNQKGNRWDMTPLGQ